MKTHVLGEVTIISVMGRKRQGTDLKKSSKKRFLSESMLGTTEIKTEPASDMEKTSKDTYLWDADHSEDGQQSINDNERLHDLLINNLTTISKSLKPTNILWTLLLEKGVIDENIKTKFQSRKTEQAQVLSLVNYLMDQEVYKFHGFIWSSVNSHQHHIAELLCCDVRDYFDMDTFMKYSNFRCPACSEFYTKAYILTGCGHYICAPCAKGAQFICKNDGKEDMTCPVPDCHKITEASPSKGSIGLDEDIPYRDLCQVVVKEMEGGHCSDCNAQVAASPVKHHCTDCDKGLCAGCTNKHKKDKGSHHVLHHHLIEQCCLHGRNTESFCEECDVYCCDQCTKGSCDHDKKEIKKDKGRKMVAGILEKAIARLNDNISCFKNHRNTLGHHEADVKEYINAEEQRIRQITNAWAQENLVQYSSIQEQVRARLSQSLQWQKAGSELLTHLITRPWLLDMGDYMEIFLKENAKIISSEHMTLVNQLCSGRAVPRVMTPIPLIMRPPDNKDGSGAEMTCPFTVENISELYRQYSPPFIIRNIPWKILVKSPLFEEDEGDDDKELSIFVYAGPKSGSSSWSCKAAIRISLLTWIPDKEPFTRREISHEFSSKVNNQGYPLFISWSELMKPENGYVKDDYIRLEVHIKTEDE